MLRDAKSFTAPKQPRRSRWRLTLATLAGGILILSACASDTERAPEMGASTIKSRPTATTQPAKFRTSSGFADMETTELDRWVNSRGAPRLNPADLQIKAASAVIVDEYGDQLYAKNANQVRPIASVSKLMTAMVVLDAGVSLDRPITIIEQDKDTLRNSRSRLRCGEARLSRRDLMMAALISSDNRAAHALARTTFRGGTPTFINAMNRKAQSLGMRNTFFADSSGLNALNRSTASDLAKMVKAAGRYSFIRSVTSRGETTLEPFRNGKKLLYRNTNPLTRDADWRVEVSKTGFINEAGHCLVMQTLMQTQLGDRRYYMVFLDASGRATNVADANRARNWIMSAQQTALR